MEKRFKVAFTLAEVLITLAIIGVVAAITLPTLIQNYKKQAYVTQLKKTVSSLENAFKLAMAEDGVDDLGDTQLWRSITAYDIHPGNIKGSKGSEFINRLSKYIKIIDVKDDSYQKVIRYLNEDGTETVSGGIFFADGSILRNPVLSHVPGIETPEEMIKKQGGHLYKFYNLAASSRNIIDVNGEKGPNQFGRDLFMFTIGQDGKLYPYYGIDHVLHYGATIEDYTTRSKYWNKDGKMPLCSTTIKSKGHGCAARIIEEGWQMNY